MTKNIMLAAVLGLMLSGTVFASKYNLKASGDRKDGVMVEVTPDYPFIGNIYVTMNPANCYNKGVYVPVDLSSSIPIATWNVSMTPGLTSTPFFHKDAPAGVHLCYTLVGRNQIETSAWGYRKADWEDGLIIPSTIGFTASRNRTDAIELVMNPPLKDFSELYVAPAEDNNCPDDGQPFSFKGRFRKVMNEPFNGRYYLDKSAPIAIDVCYFALSMKTKLSLGKTVGYREP
jgi:hypothetical protein